ncbi:phage tail terminator family protein [Brevibacillus composti]|uniref:Phage protein n=1 Tax=Brevibacillus composti TaxID=2796470 RepID=A0A7T5EME3_9BACL|nr:hypothetical protein [Brevibacillus composti]QQE75216.1 hypothetical protein JD108_04605 [Brevibacillus composti]
MLTRAQINKAINDKIKAEFPGIEIASSDVEEGFKRPSFFVMLETNRAEALQFNSLRDMTCRILFFPTSRHKYKEEAYDVMDRLEKLFGLSLPVGDRVITINHAESRLVDKVVHFDFDFEYYDDSPYEEGNENQDKMQELNYRG